MQASNYILYSYTSLNPSLAVQSHGKAWAVTLLSFFSQPKPIEVQVITHHMQRYAVWFGGSMLASTVTLHTHKQASHFKWLKSLACVKITFQHTLNDCCIFWMLSYTVFLCYYSPSFSTCVTQRKTTKSAAPASVATIRCSVSCPNAGLLLYMPSWIQSCDHHSTSIKARVIFYEIRKGLLNEQRVDIHH